MNLAERVVVTAGDLAWARDPDSSTERKPLDELTWLVRLAPGETIDVGRSHGEECLVLDGSVTYEGEELEAGTYLRIPPGVDGPLLSTSGCTLFLKRQPFAPGDVELVVKRTRQEPWFPGQGGLEVMPLHEHQGRSTALVKWPAGERFLPHRHWGGEEILVLSGTFMDEHGSYPAGCWLRSPHLSQHHPFVEEETIILVKVGHLSPATADNPS